MRTSNPVRRQLHLVGLLQGIARLVGYVVEGETGSIPGGELGGDTGHGVGRQEPHRALVEGQPAVEELVVIDPAGRHQQVMDVVPHMEQLHVGVALRPLEGEQLHRSERQQEKERNDPRQPGMQLHRPPIPLAREARRKSRPPVMK